MKTEATVLMMMMLVLKVLIDAFCTLQDCCTNAFSLRQVVGLIYTCCTGKKCKELTHTSGYFIEVLKS
jgi:hypothetical protein